MQSCSLSRRMLAAGEETPSCRHYIHQVCVTFNGRYWCYNKKTASSRCFSATWNANTISGFIGVAVMGSWGTLSCPLPDRMNPNVYHHQEHFSFIRIITRASNFRPWPCRSTLRLSRWTTKRRQPGAGVLCGRPPDIWPWLETPVTPTLRNVQTDFGLSISFRFGVRKPYETDGRTGGRTGKTRHCGLLGRPPHNNVCYFDTYTRSKSVD